MSARPATPADGRRITPLPVLALAGSMLSLQMGASLATAMFVAVGPVGATALRLGLSAVLLGLGFRAWRGALPCAVWPPLLAYGASLGCMNLCFYMALSRLSLGVAVALEFIGPLGLALVHSRRKRDLVWLALALVGLLLLLPRNAGARIAPAGGADLLGVAYALAAGMFWAAYMVTGARAGALLGRRAAPLGVAVAAIIVVPLGLLFTGPALLAPALLAPGLLLALLSGAVPYTLEMVALTRLPTRLMGLLSSAEPALAACVGWLVLGQKPDLAAAFGIGAVMLAGAGAVMDPI